MTKRIKFILALCIVFLVGIPFYLSVWTSENTISECWFLTGIIFTVQSAISSIIVDIHTS